MANILVTAGPTREYLDDVRYLTNGSTGRMGYAIAAAAAAAGHRVVLVSGPTELSTPDGVDRIDVVSAREMHDRARAAFADCDIAFGVAAVADHRPARRAVGKPPKHDGPLSLELVPNPDVVASLGRHALGLRASKVVVGFALESFAERPAADGSSRAAALERARAKLERKGLDLIVLNAPSALGGERSQVTVLAADGRQEDLPEQSKDATAAWLVARSVALAEARRQEGR
jgi:phosphopantothenoylcysteine decarboxylase/phosphopantothenate--cysteine ligase